MMNPGTPGDAVPDSIAGPADHVPVAAGPRAPRPIIERVGLAVIAGIVIVVFGLLAAASFVSGDPFLGLMAGVGALMTAWAGVRTLLMG